MTQARILSTNHTSFTVSNLERTVAFFRDALGFEVTSIAPRDPRIIQHVTNLPGAGVLIAYVRAPKDEHGHPGHSIELIQYTGPNDRSAVRPRPCDVGFAHVAYNVENVDAAVAASKTHEVLPLGTPIAIDQGPNKGKRVVYLRDPDGITIEFIGA